MGNHVKEIGKILAYRDEMLRSNLGCTCVVKVDDSDDSADGPYVHSADVRDSTCRYRSWMLKGIPCPHGIAAILYKKWEPIDLLIASIDSIGSSGVVIGPSDVPSTSRPREMPRNTPTTTDAPPRPRGRLRETSDNPKTPPRPRGRPRKTSDSPKAPPRPRGRPRKTTQAEQVARPPTLEESLNEPVAPNTRGGERDVEHVAIAARSRGRGVEHIATQGKRGRLRKTPLGDIGVARRTHLHECFENPISYTTYAPLNLPVSLVHDPLNPPVSPVDAQFSTCDRGATGKRPKTVEMGVLIAENSFTTYNPELPSRMILHTGYAQSIRSGDITGTLVTNQK
ncbi:hypothetical protein FXO37_20134 [Capsicum annuum]|nr:hypothetical protein FXO37_20134 [Capsicum annuum]